MIRLNSSEMIKECTKTNISNILYVINDASLKYKGIIPNDCWHEPYMNKKKLIYFSNTTEFSICFGGRFQYFLSN